MESDLNMYLQLVWGCHLVKNIITTNQFLPKQLGSKGVSLSSSVALLKALSFDLIHLTQSSATIFNNDATAYYDQIIPLFAMLCCMYLGLP